MQEFNRIEGDTQFNAGLAIAYQLHNIFDAAKIQRLNQDYALLMKYLKQAEIIMSPRFRTDAKARSEIEKIQSDNAEDWTRFMKRYNNGRRLPRNLMPKIDNYLTEYEKALLFYRDKFGYGMPKKGDPRFSLGSTGDD